MTTIIQVCGCKEVDGETRPFVADTEAEFYGVYIGQNGPRSNGWQISNVKLTR